MSELNGPERSARVSCDEAGLEYVHAFKACLFEVVLPVEYRRVHRPVLVLDHPSDFVGVADVVAR